MLAKTASKGLYGPKAAILRGKRYPSTPPSPTQAPNRIQSGSWPPDFFTRHASEEAQGEIPGLGSP